MPQVINTNIASLNTQRTLNSSQSMQAQALQRLSSGLRINSAKDDAAGLAISERFTTQIRGLNQATRNANDAISLTQTAEGALGSISNNLQRVRELAVQAANATNNASDRQALQDEVSQLVQEIDRVATATQFNGVNLLDGSFSAKAFQVGANVSQTITVDQIASARTSSLGQFRGVVLTNQSIGSASDTAAAQSVTVGGVTTSLGTIANDARALANAINGSGVAGLSATANVNTVVGQTSAGAPTAAGSSTVEINGTSITIAGTTSLTQNRANAVAAINAQSSVTGVVASDTGSSVTLTAADGRNISVANFAAGGATGATLASYGLAAAGTTGASINVTYQAPSTVTGQISWTGAFQPAAANIAATGTALSGINVATDANAAISAVDAALNAVNGQRATLGAIQNRFEATISNLQTSSENLTASRSRIQDADFAEETAKLTRAQILQQAGVAMLAQANALPQNVLALLRG
ncbi:MAG: flagellin [Burkholderiales bacterium]|nr:flagellin [Burkholderiales bacterium]